MELILPYFVCSPVIRRIKTELFLYKNGAAVHLLWVYNSLFQKYMPCSARAGGAGGRTSLTM